LRKCLAPSGVPFTRRRWGGHTRFLVRGPRPGELIPIFGLEVIVNLFRNHHCIRLLCLGLGLSLSGCKDTTEHASAHHSISRDAGTQSLLKLCPETRPEMCTQQYDPVCAKRDTGIRCVTTPCESSAWVTYSNGCSACSDPKVSAFKSGSCGGDGELLD
jgi:hypothetical protein